MTYIIRLLEIVPQLVFAVSLFETYFSLCFSLDSFYCNTFKFTNLSSGMAVLLLISSSVFEICYVSFKYTFFMPLLNFWYIWHILIIVITILISMSANFNWSFYPVLCVSGKFLFYMRHCKFYPTKVLDVFIFL